VGVVTDPRLCILCRGARYLCGKAYCPILARFVARQRVAEASTNLFGSSPPAVFVGRVGYPYVYAGPLAPNEVGDTSIYDLPESWVDRPVDDVLSFRLGLFLGRRLVDVGNVSDRFVQELQVVVLPLKPVDVEIRFAKKPTGFSFSEYEPPIGPRAPLDT